MSFSAGTKVLLASGKAVPIASLKPGQKVLATNTRTGQTRAETISVVMVHRDTNLYDLKVKADGRTAIIHTTSNHPFWDANLKQWRPAAKLKRGEHLLTANGTPAVADGGTTPKDHDGWMWDLTIQGDHDFYVEPATVLLPTRAGPKAVPVLVHNCGDDAMARMIHDAHPDQYLRDRVITVGVMTTDQGRFAAQAGSEFTEEQMGVMAAHGIEPRPFSGNMLHAESQLLDFARNGDLLQEGGMAKESIGASRPFCGPERADCAGLLEKAGATIVGRTLAGW